MTQLSRSRHRSVWLLLAALAATIVVYWPGLSGSWLFDDFPNIVENPGVQPTHIDLASLTRAVLSSPSSEFKRPLASLSFAANYLAGGLNPFGWKLTNLGIHLLNGVLLFLLTRMLLELRPPPDVLQGSPDAVQIRARAGIVSACIAAAWLLLPINLTGVLYVVQRMESMANAFVLLGLIGYVTGRRYMLGLKSDLPHPQRKRGLLWCAGSLLICTSLGVTAKETAVMLPLYALLTEWIVFDFRSEIVGPRLDVPAAPIERSKPDRMIAALFFLFLVIPLVAGLTWLLPHVLSPEAWATRDFTLQTRLLTEARIVVGYIAWCLLALPHWLSFYHDGYTLSTSLLHPWTTGASIMMLVALIGAVFVLRRSRPLISLGIALFLGCHLLTATVLPLELIYEHRNYFASYGLLLALIPMLTVQAPSRFARARAAAFAIALLAWTVMTATTAYAWGDSLRLARELAARAPDSPRAQYELGRSYIVASHYDPDSPYTPLVYTPLERAARLPDSSILPQQALIFFNARMHRPIKDTWWNSLIESLQRRNPGVQDESSLAALSRCARDGLCPLPEKRMQEAFEAAVSHPGTDARLWASYGDYAWNVMGKHDLGLDLTRRAVRKDPGEPAYRITLTRMLVVRGELGAARAQIDALRRLDIGGSLNSSISALESRISNAACESDTCPDQEH